MIIAIVLLEFQYQSFVERKLAYNDLNQLQAYYLAKSGARIGLLRVALFARAKKTVTDKSIQPFLDMVWSLPLPAFPPDANKLGKLLKDDKDAAQKVLKETNITEGKFTHVISSESSKINLNYLVVPSAKREERITFQPPATELYQNVALTLITLMQNFLRDSDDPYNEFPNLNPEEVVFNIMDWINPGQQSFAGGNKDAFYQQQVPPYLAKRNRLYSVEELRMVKGIDDHLYNKLKPYVTVYSFDGKININNATTEVLRALYKDFTDDDIKRLGEEKSRIGGSWANEGQFVTFITQTLGRSGFQTQYPTAGSYPFTVASQSFMIESMGVITRSKSSIQKIIRVGVALGSGKGCQLLAATEPVGCNGQAGFWDTRVPPGQCKSFPKSQSDCENICAGGFNATNNTCTMNGIAPITIGGAGTPPTTPGGSGAPTSNPVTVEPNAVKILFWSES